MGGLLLGVIATRRARGLLLGAIATRRARGLLLSLHNIENVREPFSGLRGNTGEAFLRRRSCSEAEWVFSRAALEANDRLVLIGRHHEPVA